MRIGIVGGGLAGLRVAAELRAAGYSDSIIVWSAEGEPYDRPPLSKELMGQPLHPLAGAGLGELGELASEIRGEARQISPEATAWSIDGEAVDVAVMATGSRPTHTIPGAHVLYTSADAAALRREAASAERVDIVGAGWVGTELASVLAEGRRVTLWEASQNVLERSLGPHATPMWEQWLAAAGVELRLGTPFPGRADSLVIQATGSRPALDALDPAVPRNERGALATDTTTAVLGFPGLFAVGDCGDHRLTGGHWTKALHDGEWTASAILGAPLPRFEMPAEVFSDQFGHSIALLGVPEGEPRMDATDEGWTLTWESDGELCAVLAVDSPRQAAAARRALRRRS